jgi:hypothetical protein
MTCISSVEDGEILVDGVEVESFDEVALSAEEEDGQRKIYIQVN